MRLGRALAIAGTACVLLLAMVPAAQAGAVIEVFPGPNAIQNAITAASAGDTLLIHSGTYNERVVVGKAGLHLRAYGDGPVTVDGNCTEFTVIEVNANAVMIDGLRVRGATYYGVDFENVVGGTITRSILRDTCHAVYGVNLYSTDGGMTVSGNVAVGFSDAGIYLGFITSTGAEHIQVANNVSLGNNRGIIIEDIASATNVEVTGNTTRTNRATGVNPTNAGIFLHNADGVLVDRNTVRRNDESGIELDINSSGNVVSNNVVSGHTFDLANFGSSNCFSGNTYTTSTGSLPACR